MIHSVEPGCTCGGMATCPQCQERDAHTTESDAPARQCDRCRDNALGLGSSARCICGPNVPCGWCGQGLTRVTSPGETQ